MIDSSLVGSLRIDIQTKFKETVFHCIQFHYFEESFGYDDTYP